MNIWRYKASIWVNKMNFCIKIEIWSILQKCKFWYCWTDWTFVTDEYLKIRSSNLGVQIELFEKNRNSINISKLQVLIWVNKLNFSNKIEIWSIYTKMRVLIPVNKLNFSTDEYLKIRSSNLGEQSELF